MDPPWLSVRDRIVAGPQSLRSWVEDLESRLGRLDHAQDCNLHRDKLTVEGCPFVQLCLPSATSAIIPPSPRGDTLFQPSSVLDLIPERVLRSSAI